MLYCCAWSSLLAVVERLPLFARKKARWIRAVVARGLGALRARAAGVGAAAEFAVGDSFASRVAHFVLSCRWRYRAIVRRAATLGVGARMDGVGVAVVRWRGWRGRRPRRRPWAAVVAHNDIAATRPDLGRLQTSRQTVSHCLRANGWKSVSAHLLTVPPAHRRQADKSATVSEQTVGRNSQPTSSRRHNYPQANPLG